MPELRRKLKLVENKLTTMFYILLRDKFTLGELDYIIGQTLSDPDQNFAPYGSSHIKGVMEDCRQKAAAFIERGAAK